MNQVLIMVDLQNDFMPGGALGVPSGEQVVPIANEVQPCFEHVIATQDWHPRIHESFAVNHPTKKIGDIIDLHGLPQVLWPVHCVEETKGAALVDGLETSRIERIFHKGTDPQIDSYSAFFDNEHRKETGLRAYLQSLKISQVHILGLATDYCVKFTVLDACRLDFDVYIIEDGCRGIDLSEGDSIRSRKEIQAVGAKIIKSEKLIASSRKA
jgi:nicotinamidase/pyrazinamidase